MGHQEAVVAGAETGEVVEAVEAATVVAVVHLEAQVKTEAIMAMAVMAVTVAGLPRPALLKNSPPLHVKTLSLSHPMCRLSMIKFMF